jgi:CDP-glucose 4,6-dehydratase
MASLKWKGVWDSEMTFEKTVKWYKSYYENDKVFLTQEDLESYIADAKEKNIEWAAIK